MAAKTSDDWIRISNKYRSICNLCRKEVSPGDPVLWSKEKKAIKHLNCSESSSFVASVTARTDEILEEKVNKHEGSARICVKCSIEIPLHGAKFCPSCGHDLSGSLMSIEDKQVSNDTPEFEGVTVEQFEHEKEDAVNPISVEELGKRLEDMTEQILKSMGYSTQKRQRLMGKSGASHEIDIVAMRAERMLAVECKNYSRFVGIDEVRDFQSKLEDLKIKEALIVTNVFFSHEAETYANHKNIKMWNGKQLREHFFSMTLGRLGSAHEIELSLSLPVIMTIDEVSKIVIANTSSVRLGRPRLIFHPYYKFDYSLDITRKNPARGFHRISDSGTYIVDAIDGEIINKRQSVGSKIAGKLFGNTEESMHIREEKQIAKDLLEIMPVSHYKIQSTTNFDLSKLRYEVSFKQSRWTVIHQVVEDNTKEVTYRVRVSRDRVATKRMPIIPRPNEVTIQKLSVIYVPKWNVEIDANNVTYVRRALAASTTILLDTITMCPKHLAIGKMQLVKKQTFAVCELCGGAFCKDHIVKVNDAYYCDVDNPAGQTSKESNSLGKGLGSLFKRK